MLSTSTSASAATYTSHCKHMKKRRPMSPLYLLGALLLLLLISPSCQAVPAPLTENIASGITQVAETDTEPAYFQYTTAAAESTVTFIVESCDTGSVEGYVSLSGPPQTIATGTKLTLQNGLLVGALEDVESGMDVFLAVSVAAAGTASFRAYVTLSEQDDYPVGFDLNYTESITGSTNFVLSRTIEANVYEAFEGYLINLNATALDKDAWITPCMASNLGEPISGSVTETFNDDTNSTITLSIDEQNLTKNSSYALILLGNKDTVNNIFYTLAFSFGTTKFADGCEAMEEPFAFCSQIRYSIWANGKDPYAEDDRIKQTYDNFAFVLSQYNCEGIRYSYVRTCTHCLDFYKVWICRTQLPKCADEVQDHDTSIWPEFIELPCLTDCWNVSQSCPDFVQFSCPHRGSLAQISQYSRGCSNSAISALQSLDPSLLVLLTIAITLFFY